jgi:hypothetical protein
MRTVHSMDFKEAQFIYDNMSEEYPDDQKCEQDYDCEPDEHEEDFNAEFRWW